MSERERIHTRLYEMVEMAADLVASAQRGDRQAMASVRCLMDEIRGDILLEVDEIIRQRDDHGISARSLNAQGAELLDDIAALRVAASKALAVLDTEESHRVRARASAILRDALLRHYAAEGL